MMFSDYGFHEADLFRSQEENFIAAAIRLRIACDRRGAQGEMVNRADTTSQPTSWGRCAIAGARGDQIGAGRSWIEASLQRL